MAPTTVFYTLQGQGDDLAHPNAFYAAPAAAGALTLADVQAAFPLRHAGQFAWRFREPHAKLGFVWRDAQAPNAELPTLNGKVIAKVLRVDQPPQPKAPRRRLRRKPLRLFDEQSQSHSQAERPAPYRDEQPRPSPYRDAPARRRMESDVSDMTTDDDDEEVGYERQRGPEREPEPEPEPTPKPKPKPAEEPAPQPFEVNWDDAAPASPAAQTDMWAADSPAGGGGGGGQHTGDTPLAPKHTDTTGKSEYVRAAVAAREQAANERERAALEEKRRLEAEALRRQEEREAAHERLGAALDAWAIENGQKKNIRHLLASMHDVLWEGARWREVPMSKLILPNQVKLAYRKAMLVVHPDRNAGAEASQAFIAERCFEAINGAWEIFEQNEM